MSNLSLKETLELMLRCANGEVYDFRFSRLDGICGNLQYLSDERYWCSSYMRTLYSEWPKFSGTEEYPVPAQGMDGYDAYDFLPLWTGDYGQLRKELLQFCIDNVDPSL